MNHAGCMDRMGIQCSRLRGSSLPVCNVPCFFSISIIAIAFVADCSDAGTNGPPEASRGFIRTGFSTEVPPSSRKPDSSIY